MYKEAGYYLDGEQQGEPIDRATLVEMINTGALGADRRVRHWGSEKWMSLAEALAEPEEAAQAVLPPLPPSFLSIGSAETDKWSHLAIPNIKDTNGWSRLPVAPWRRCAARTLDTLVEGWLGSLLLFYVLFSVAPVSAMNLLTLMQSSSGLFISAIMSTGLSALLGGFIIGATGTSLGKWFFGVKVLSGQLRPIGIGAGLAREFNVLFAGLGLGFPFISFLTQIVAFNRLKRDGETSWDADSYLVVHRPAGGPQTMLNICGIIVFFVMAMLLL
jgi:uncharacterized RDD family membrane protein YckC